MFLLLVVEMQIFGLKFNVKCRRNNFMVRTLYFTTLKRFKREDSTKTYKLVVLIGIKTHRLLNRIIFIHNFQSNYARVLNRNVFACLPTTVSGVLCVDYHKKNL